MFTLIIEDRNGEIADEFSFEHGTYYIGRGQENDIILPSSGVSRRHAKLFIHQGRCFVEDLRSANGVVVDGHKIVEPMDLGTAAQIRIGEYYLYLDYSRKVRDAAQDVLSTHIVAQDANVCKLVRIGDGFAGEEFSLTEPENTIGRTDDNFILLSDGSISRHHSTILNDGMNYSVMDMGSSNHTMVNGKIISELVYLQPHDRVTFGSVHFIFVSGSEKVDVNALSLQTSKPTKSGGGKGLVIGIVIFFFFLIMGGIGFFAYVMFFKDDSDNIKTKTEKQTTKNTIDPKAEADKRILEAQNKIKKEDWEGALRDLMDALAYDPNNINANELKEHVESEANAKLNFEEGLKLYEVGNFQDAKKVLERIPNTSRYSSPANHRIEFINTTLARKWVSEANEKQKDKNYLKSYELYCQSMKLDPTQSGKIIGELKGLEKKMNKKGLKYTTCPALQ